MTYPKKSYRERPGAPNVGTPDAVDGRRHKQTGSKYSVVRDPRGAV